ncbi:hypothetical protein VCRLGP7_690100 [Vibrio crassostreae]|nr:hypothetical protein VCRLGP107_410098 [Vibrio crassostreae]CDT40411.1 hypothetical protein VCRLGP7_690100 [Vibrio crassostreae]
MNKRSSSAKSPSRKRLDVTILPESSNYLLWQVIIHSLVESQ